MSRTDENYVAISAPAVASGKWTGRTSSAKYRYLRLEVSCEIDDGYGGLEEYTVNIANDSAAGYSTTASLYCPYNENIPFTNLCLYGKSTTSGSWVTLAKNTGSAWEVPDYDSGDESSSSSS